MVSLSWLPFGSAFRPFRVGQFYVKPAVNRIDFDHITIPQQRDGAANGRFRPDMADTEPSGRAGKPAIRNECDLAAHALPGQRRRGREHLSHARHATLYLVADHNDLALFVGFLLDGLKSILFAVKTARGPGESQIRH